MTAASVIYSAIFTTLRRQGRSSRFMPRRGASPVSDDSAASLAGTQLCGDDTNTNTNNGGRSTSTGTPLRPSGHHPAFLIYPCIYGVTGTPLILGSLIPALERNVVFMGVAGGLLAATGLLDSILWSSIVLFSKKEDLADVGLDKFAFTRTPEGRNLGNIVLIQGGRTSDKRQHHRQSWHSKKDQGWWRLGDRNNSQPSLPQEHPPEMDDGIQMEIVTSVVVESQECQAAHSRAVSRDRSKSVESQM